MKLGLKAALPLLAVAFAAALPAAPALAQYEHDHDHDRGRFHGRDFDRHDERRDWDRRGPGWHGEIHRFGDHDLDVWRGGRWWRGPHEGRLGWWWIVGGIWYFYPQPVYPYPDPYMPPMAEMPPAAAVPVPNGYWYWCEPAQAYYPYVARCPVPWRPVPAR